MINKSLGSGILFTDQYQLTMAQLYFRMGLHERTAQFDHFFRSYPDYGGHRAGYCVQAGLAWLLDWMREARFTEGEIDFLRGQKNRNGGRVFAEDFLKWLLENGSFDEILMMSIPEGRVVHPEEPLSIIQGPLAMAQILETGLLNQLNYQTLIATKAARLRQICGESLVLDFGARRGHDLGANAGARAALIGGVDFSSNVGISHLLGLAPKGTHAHSMVQAFMALGEGELAAFRAYADVYPDDCLLLVDTINTIESGIPNAITVFEELRRKGHEPVGIRLDSGDLAHLSIQAAKMLDDAGFNKAAIVLSNQLDEFTILKIHKQITSDAPSEGVDPDGLIKRLVYGVGTKLITSEGDAALDGVYKLAAVQDENGGWVPATKVSESIEKVVNPGEKRIWRLYDKDRWAIADLIALAGEKPDKEKEITLHHPVREEVLERRARDDIEEIEPLLIIVKDPHDPDGNPKFLEPELEAMRNRCADDLARLKPDIQDLVEPKRYQVSLTTGLWNLKLKLLRRAGESGSVV